ncbi:MAG: hypothetical protein ABIH23_34960, partial [bacterium]
GELHSRRFQLAKARREPRPPRPHPAVGGDREGEAPAEPIFAEYELELSDEWDKEIERDSQEGGRLGDVLKRVRADIAAGRTN